MAHLSSLLAKSGLASRRSVLGRVGLAAMGVCCLTPFESGWAKPDEVVPRKIVVGALLSLTGEWSSLGLASQAALQIAVDDLNAEFREAGLPTVVELRVEDTKLNPVLAEQAFLKLARRYNVSVVIGPQSSSEVRAIKPLADRLGVLVVSQGSTASSLAFADDSIFRFCPADVEEGAAMAGLMVVDKITTVVPFWRADPGNDGLHNSTKSAFAALGGTFTEGVRYAESETSFTDEVLAIAGQVRAASVPGATVGVYLASFDEGIAILELARHYPELAGIKWYSGDGLTQSVALLASPTAAAFAAAVRFTAPTVGLDPAAAGISQPLSDKIQAKVGFVPDAFALAAYDATIVAVLARQEVPVQRGTKSRVKSLWPTFVRNANRYWGATGAATLNAAGDRKVGNYDFFTVVDGAGGLSWQFTGAFVNGQVIE
jgi:branched-chain amino acid transport system substrate-binding protein